MADAHLRKLQQELAALQEQQAQQVRTLTSKEACSDLVRYVTSSKEPLSADEQKWAGSNPWVSSNTGQGGCCTVS